MGKKEQLQEFNGSGQQFPGNFSFDEPRLIFLAIICNDENFGKTGPTRSQTFLTVDVIIIFRNGKHFGKTGPARNQTFLSCHL